MSFRVCAYTTNWLAPGALVHIRARDERRLDAFRLVMEWPTEQSKLWVREPGMVWVRTLDAHPKDSGGWIWDHELEPA